MRCMLRSEFLGRSICCHGWPAAVFPAGLEGLVFNPPALGRRPILLAGIPCQCTKCQEVTVRWPAPRIIRKDIFCGYPIAVEIRVGIPLFLHAERPEVERLDRSHFLPCPSTSGWQSDTIPDQTRLDIERPLRTGFSIWRTKACHPVAHCARKIGRKAVRYLVSVIYDEFLLCRAEYPSRYPRANFLCQWALIVRNNG